MKKFVFSLAALALLTISSLGQSIIFQDDGNSRYDTTIGFSRNYTQDLNLELLFGTTPTTVYNAVVTLLLSSTNSNASGSGALGQVYSASGDISFTGGLIYDNSSTEYMLPGYAGDTIYLQILAWTGSDTNYFDAVRTGDGLGGESQVFTETLGTGPTSFPTDISNFGLINVGLPVPEPATMALVGLGGLALLVLRRKK